MAIVINSATGEIDLNATTPGTYKVTYTTNGSCPITVDNTITVNALDGATFAYSSNSLPQTGTASLTTTPTTSGGVFSAYPSGLSINSSTGEINLANSTIQSYKIFYETSGAGCPNSSTFDLAVTSAFTGLLDTYTGSQAAYSLRRLSSSYTGNLIRVTKKVSNVISTTDIGYNSNNELDTTALATFASGADNGEVRVDIWYDQSGNSNNVTQSSFTGCPYIYQSGSLITENSKPAIKNGGNIALETTNSPFNSQVLSSFMVNKYYTTSNYHVLLTIGNSNATSFRFFNVNNYGNWRANGLNLNGTSGDLDIQNLSSAYNTTTNLYARYNGSQFGTASGTAGAFTSSEIRIGKNLANANQNFNGTYQEFIFYSSEQSSNMSGIETNINNYYSIY